MSFSANSKVTRKIFSPLRGRKKILPFSSKVPIKLDSFLHLDNVSRNIPQLMIFVLSIRRNRRDSRSHLSPDRSHERDGSPRRRSKLRRQSSSAARTPRSPESSSCCSSRYLLSIQSEAEFWVSSRLDFRILATRVRDEIPTHPSSVRPDPKQLGDNQARPRKS